MRSYRYDVALSYAGEDRKYVTEVAEHLQSARVNVYFDKFETASMWGKNLITHLSRIYRDEARYFVPFVSKHYVKKPWPRREADAAFARALRESEYVLPVRFDETELPGLELTTAWIDAQNLPPIDLAQLIIKKVNSGFSPADISAFYDLWHASVPTRGVVERLQERLERASVSGTKESRICQARLSVALAEQYTKMRDSVKARAAIARALSLTETHTQKSMQSEELQVMMDCKWLTLIVERLENQPFFCVRNCQSELNMIAKKLSRRPPQPLRSQYLFHRMRIERSLITYYQLAGMIPESLVLAKALETDRWPKFDKDILSEELSAAHLLPISTMKRLLVYEKFQTARRIFSAYVYVGDHRSALRFVSVYFQAFEALVKAGAMDTISMVVFNRLCGNCAGFLALNDPSKSGNTLRAIAKQAFTLSRLSALQQELPSSYLQDGMLERTIVPTIEIGRSQLPSKARDGQLAYLRRLKRAFAAVQLGERIGIELVYRYKNGRIQASIGLLSSGGGRSTVAAYCTSKAKGAELKTICESLLLSLDEAHGELSVEKEIKRLLKGVLRPASFVQGAEISIFFARWDQKARRLYGFSFGNVTLICKRKICFSSRDEVTLFDIVIPKGKMYLLLGKLPSKVPEPKRELVKREQYSRVDFW